MGDFDIFIVGLIAPMVVYIYYYQLCTSYSQVCLVKTIKLIYSGWLESIPVTMGLKWGRRPDIQT